jgi:mRNA interferase MazF
MNIEQWDIWLIKIDSSAENGLRKTSGIECFQVKSFSENRFVRKLGAIPAAQVEEIHLTR